MESRGSVFSTDQLKDLETAFQAFAKDGRAPTPSLNELIHSVGVNATPEEVQDMELDIAADEFDYDTFVYLVYRAARANNTEAGLVRALRVFDEDGSGKVNKAVIQRILTNLKDPYSPGQVDEVLKLVSFDEDGSIECTEFVKVLLGL
jgi:Ca2+-binding EF-hand superfamily protein